MSETATESLGEVDPKTALLDAHQFAPEYPVVCSCGFSAGFAMDSETPWIHHVAHLLRGAGLADPDPDVTLNIVKRLKVGADSAAALTSEYASALAPAVPAQPSTEEGS